MLKLFGLWLIFIEEPGKMGGSGACEKTASKCHSFGHSKI
jgi:hypothetical protein